jgi:hypothetical protein
MTTVGYGDIIPNTNFGRLFTMLACFGGNFILQLITVTLMKKINMNE